jgi:hypothetical protein
VRPPLNANKIRVDCQPWRSRLIWLPQEIRKNGGETPSVHHERRSVLEFSEQPAGATPTYQGGALASNIAANLNEQVKASPGVYYGLNVTSAGTGSTASIYDGLSSPGDADTCKPGSCHVAKSRPRRRGSCAIHYHGRAAHGACSGDHLLRHQRCELDRQHVQWCRKHLAQKVRRTGKTDACLIQGADLTRTLELLEPSRRFARA